MPPITVMLKPASGLCNMRCRYCFYADEMAHRTTESYGIMQQDTLEAIIKRVLAFAEGSCNFMYQGGEPTLAGLSFFEQALEFQKKWNVNRVVIENGLQTNGYAIDEAWAEFFASNHFQVGISLDGPKDIHDANRVDAQGKGTYNRVMHAIQLLQKHKVEFNILTVVTRQAARSTGKIYGFFQRNGFAYQQYIPCLDPWEEGAQTPYSLTAKDFEQHLKLLFDQWYQQAVRGDLQYNRYFFNLLAILNGQMPEACEMRGVCGRQFVVEADGSVYPCDFYMLDEYRLGNLVTDDFETIERRRQELAFVETSARIKESCKGCKWFALCRGGCRRNWEPVTGPDPRNVFCSAYQGFLEYAFPRLQQLSRMLQEGRR